MRRDHMKKLLIIVLLLVSCQSNQQPLAHHIISERPNRQQQFNITSFDGTKTSVNYGEDFILAIPENHKVFINDQEAQLDENNELSIQNITSDYIIRIEEIPVVEEPPVVEKPPIVEEPPKVVDYSQYSNEDLSWWYRAGTTATIDSGIANLISGFDVLWKVDTTQKIVYLTMDEGYEYLDNTSRILDIAKEKNVKITFFITGSYLDRQPNLVLRMLQEGHVVANHTDKHLRAPSITTEQLKEDITLLENKYQQLTGQPIASLYRPPEGGYSERSLAIAEDLGYTTVFWSFAYRDWLTDDQPDPAEAYQFIMNQLHPGAILLIHAVSVTNVEILPDLIDGIRDQGYTIGILR